MIVLHFSQNRGVGWRRETAEELLDLVEPGSGDGSELNVEAWMSDLEVLVRRLVVKSQDVVSVTR